VHRRVTTVLFIAVFASSLGTGFIGPLMPLYARDFGAAGLSLGMIFAGFSFAQFLLTPVIGRLSDRHGRKIFLTTGLAVYALFSLAYVSAHTLTQLILVRVLHGGSAGMVIPIAQAYLGDISPKGREGSAMGALMVSLFLAFGLGPLLAGPLADRFGMHTPFFAMGALSALALLFTVVFLPELGIHRERWHRRAPIRAVLGSTVMIGTVIFRASVAFGRGLVIPFLPFVAESRGASLSVIGVLLATNILLAGLLQIPFGRLCDRVSKPLLMAASIAAMSIVIYSIPYCSTVKSLFWLQTATGVVMALGIPASLALVTQVGRHTNGMGTAMAIFTSGENAGFIIGALSGGLIAGSFGLDFVFKGGSLVIVATFAAFLLLARKARNDGSFAALELESEKALEAAGLS
jgi:DHA1 family multidrug resistance protein-like MFS transporter